MADSQDLYVLQGVQTLYDITKLEGDVGIPETGKLVFIGKGLSPSVRDSLQNLF